MNKIYKIPITPYKSVAVDFDKSYIVWLDNHGFTHIFYCIDNEDIQNAINLLKKKARDFNSIKYVIVNNLDVKYKYEY